MYAIGDSSSGKNGIHRIGFEGNNIDKQTVIMRCTLLKIFTLCVCVESDSDDEASDKSGSSRSRRKHKESSTPLSDKRLSVTSNESSSTKVSIVIVL